MTDRGNRRQGRLYAVPAAGLGLVLLGTIGTAGLADSATESDGLAAFDPELTADVVSVRRAGLTEVAQVLTFIGSMPVLVLLTVVGAIVLRLLTASWRAPGLLVGAMVGSAITTYALKLAVGRQRPGADLVLGPPDANSAFPSGHALNSAVFFGMLAGLMWVGTRSTLARLAVLTGAVVISAGIGLSRIYLGYHWATDVLAGWLAALTWLAIVGTVAYVTRSRSRPDGSPAA